MRLTLMERKQKKRNEKDKKIRSPPHDARRSEKTPAKKRTEAAKQTKHPNSRKRTTQHKKKTIN